MTIKVLGETYIVQSVSFLASDVVIVIYFDHSMDNRLRHLTISYREMRENLEIYK